MPEKERQDGASALIASPPRRVSMAGMAQPSSPSAATGEPALPLKSADGSGDGRPGVTPVDCPPELNRPNNSKHARGQSAAPPAYAVPARCCF